MMNMYYPDTGLQLFGSGQAIEKVAMKGLEVSLLGAGEGTEIIHHRLNAGSRWAMVPEEGWSALESIFILKGRLILQRPNDNDVVLKAGDSLSASPLKDHALFIAGTDVEFLYICSQPVFHYYSQYVRDMMELAVSVEEKDGYTADHCDRIKKMSMLLGEALELSSKEMYQLNYGSFLHDVGKVTVPAAILGKPGKLTAEEWEIMKSHTVYGREMLEKTGLPNLIAAGKVVEQHHERFDGSGYPYGLKGSDILIGSAIVAVVDSYDAMTTDRCYQKGRTKDAALSEILRCRGTLYHPDVVDTFLSLEDKLDL